MAISETLPFYLLIGAVVSAAMPATARAPLGQRLARGAAHVVCWPFFAPGLFGRAAALPEPKPTRSRHRARLHQARARLGAALQSLHGLSESLVRPQLDQIEAVMASLDTASDRLQEMDELLRTPEFDAARVDAALAPLREKGLGDADPRVASLLSRQGNIRRLRAMQSRTGDELERALFTLEELSSEVMLLKFADNPESKLPRVLGDMAASLRELSSLVLEMSEV
ncbi:MAG TPA: hypothetical protein VMG12_29430 [Polyangiaceae bacterium]|nr:hypothetical protein [Polyangiaceae bacterium]